MIKTELISKRFDDEREALEYWNSMSGEYRSGRLGTFLADGRFVVSNEIEYCKDGSFFIETKVQSA